MAVSKRAIEQHINARRAKGISDAVILAEMTKAPNALGDSVNGFLLDAKKQGLNPQQSFAQIFGLNLNPTKTASKGGFLDKIGSMITSAGDGLKESVDGLEQGQMWLKDKIGQGINAVVGKDIAPTNSYDKHNIDRQNSDTVRKEFRAKAGLKGADISKFAGEVAGTAPIMMATGAMGAGARGAATFAAKQAALGATSGAMRGADDASQRKSNMIGEAVGGAIGGVVGEKVLAPVAGKVAGKFARNAANKIPPTPIINEGAEQTARGTAQAANKIIDDAIKTTKLDVSDTIRQHLIKDAEQFLKTGKEVDGAALVRKKLLENYGVKGTQAQITRDPALWTAEREAAKYSTDLNNVHIANHQQLDELMQDLVTKTGAKPVNNTERMGSTFNTLKQADEQAQKKVSELYDNAKNLSGNDAQLNHVRFINEASKELEANGLGSFMSGDIKGIFKGMFNDPNFVLTHAKSEEIVKVINKRLRATSDGNERYALGIIKDNLTKETDRTIDEMTGLLGSSASDGGLAGAKDAWQTARGAARQRFETLESTPMLKAAVDGAEPDKALNRHVLNGNAADIVRTVDVLKNTQGGEQAIADMQGAVIEHFLSKAKSSNGGAFSPAGLHRALNSFGDQRLKALFTPEQISRLNDIKQVADILVQQPLGAHVNHSNTGSVLIKQLLNIASGLSKGASKIPMIGNAALGIANGVASAGKKGAAIKMLDDQVPVTPNSTLGLTPEMLDMLGLVKRSTSGATATTGATLGGQ